MLKHIGVTLGLCGLLAALPAFAQAPSYSPDQLTSFVARIALYPDPLLAQVLTAATFSDQLADAARWADQHRDLKGEPLALAMQHRRLPWDPTVQSLLPFPSVLDMVASDASFTELGSAFLVQQQDVLKAVQSDRVKAKDFGYLKSNKHIAVDLAPTYVAIIPTDPGEIFVPAYDPAVVFSAPPAGVAVADAIHYVGVSVGGFAPAGFTAGKFQVIGGYFQAWGWGLGGIDWVAHTVIVNRTPWRRNWTNRGNYVHRYPDLEHIAPAQ